MSKRKQSRRPAADSKERILDAAENQLVRSGIDGVRVQTVAQELGMTDAAVHYHFKSRSGLIEALLKRVARRLRADMSHVAEQAQESEFDFKELLARLSDSYDQGQGARLALWLSLSGWQDRGSGMFLDLIEAAKSERPRKSAQKGDDDTAFLIMLANIVMIAQPLYGEAMLRAAGLKPTESNERKFQDWFANLLQTALSK